MLASKLCRIPITSFVSGIGRPLNKPQLCMRTRTQQLASDSRSGATRRAQRTRISLEKLTTPAGETAFTVGKGMVAGGAALGLGSLCFYGLASKEISALDKRAFWSDEVKQRIRSTYFYFGASVGLTAATAVAIARTPALMNIAMKSSMTSMIGGIVALIGTSMLTQSIPYKEGIGSKQLAWMLHSAVVGGIVAPLTMLGGPLLVRAAWYTAGVVGGLSALAMCAPSEKFLNMGGPLAIGLGVVFVSSLGSMFLPPTTSLGAGLYHYCNEKTLRLSKNPEETLSGTEKTLRDPEVGTESTDETLRDPEVGTEGTEETLSDPEVCTEGTEEALRDPEVGTEGTE